MHYIEAERQKWEACKARLAAQSDEAMNKIAELNDQSEARENTRLLSVSKESDETIEPVSSFVSLTVSHAHTNVIKEVSKSVILIETPAGDSYSISYPPVSMLNQLPLLYKYWLHWARLKVNGINGNIWGLVHIQHTYIHYIHKYIHYVHTYIDYMHTYIH